MPQSPLELGRNPDQGLQINKVFRIVGISYSLYTLTSSIKERNPAD